MDRQRARFAWVLNLDADLELAAGGRHAPTKAVLAAMQPHVATLAATLLAPEDVLVDERTPPGFAQGLIGRAFCPTPRAVAALTRAGAVPEPHPAEDVLGRVNGRAFCSALGATLPHAVFVRNFDAALAILARPPEIARQWRVKRAFGMAGRGQRVVAPGALDPAERAFVRASIAADGGVAIEPNVAIVQELARHGRLAPSGALSLGELVAQRCDARGQWLASERASDVDPETCRAIEDEVRRVASALADAGYFGPFGVDAFLYRDLAGKLCLQPRSEINARYSMGFGIGFGGA